MIYTKRELKLLELEEYLARKRAQQPSCSLDDYKINRQPIEREQLQSDDERFAFPSECLIEGSSLERSLTLTK